MPRIDPLLWFRAPKGVFRHCQVPPGQQSCSLPLFWNLCSRDTLITGLKDIMKALFSLCSFWITREIDMQISVRDLQAFKPSTNCVFYREDMFFIWSRNKQVINIVLSRKWRSMLQERQDNKSLYRDKATHADCTLIGYQTCLFRHFY